MRPTDRIVAYVKNACYEDLPSAVIDKAKIILLDTIGVGLAGALTDPAMILLDLIKEMKGKPQATLIRDGTRVNCIQAGFYNSYCMDVMDFEETFEGLGHPNGSVIPAGLAIGEWAHCSGKDLIVAIIVGNEVSIRLGLAMRPSRKRSEVISNYNWHSFGAGITASKLLGLNEKQIMDAIAITGSSTPVATSNPRWERPLHWIKNNFALQTEAGIMGALFAQKGFTGPQPILDSDLGFWRMTGSDRCQKKLMDKGLGKKYKILKVGFKPYPCCRWLHPTLDAVAELMKEHHLDAGMIKKIRVATISELRNWFMDYEPETLVDVQFSLPYSVALIVHQIRPGLDWFKQETIRDRKIRDTARRVKVEASDSADRAYFKATGGPVTSRVEILTKNGEKMIKTANVMRGDPDRPIDVFKKFEGTASSAGFTSRRIKRIVDLVHNLDKMENVSQLARAIVLPRRT
jgi:2-methylcitrate dehydratase PrpD